MNTCSLPFPRNLLFIFSTCCVAFFAACELSSDDQEIFYEVDWKSDFELQPYEIAVLKVDKPVDAEEVELMFGETRISVSPNNEDSTIAFLVPEVEAGSYEMYFVDIDASGLMVQVKEAQTVKPEEVLAEQEVVFDSITTNLTKAKENGYDISAQEISSLKNAFYKFNSEYQALDEEDKLKVATFLKVNGITELRNSFVNTTDSFYRSKKGNNLSPDAELKTLATGLIVSRVTASAALGALAYLLKTIPKSPWGLAAAGISTAVAGGSILTHNALAERAVNCQGVISKIEADLRKKSIEFTAGNQVIVDTKAEFRTVRRQDNNSSNSLAKEVTNQAIYAIRIYNNAIDYVERIESFLGTDVFNFRKSRIDIDDESSSRAYRADVNNFSVGNVTGGVSIESEIENGQLALIANGNEETNFSFDLIYSDSETGSNLIQEIDASLVLPVDSIPIYEAAVVGRWQAINIESGNVSKLTIQADGSGFYDDDYDKTTGSGGDDGKGNWFVTWEIVKINGRYHLREYGFWHSGFEGYRVFDIEFDKNFLTYPVSTFKTYTSFSPRDEAVREYIKQ